MGTLWLIRHAEASDKPTGGSDHERPLSNAGWDEARALGEWLAVRGAEPDAVLGSAALRVRETIDGLALPMREAPLFEAGLYLAPADALLERLQDLEGSGAASVLLVAHNPGVAELAAWLVAPEERPRLRGGFPPCTLAWLRWQDRLAPGHSELIERVTPAALDAGSGQGR